MRWRRSGGPGSPRQSDGLRPLVCVTGVSLVSTAFHVIPTILRLSLAWVPRLAVPLCGSVRSEAPSPPCPSPGFSVRPAGALASALGTPASPGTASATAKLILERERHRLLATCDRGLRLRPGSGTILREAACLKYRSLFD
jgi:hypothetical protein